MRGPVLRRHTAIVLVDRIDLATARAIQYARNLSPDELYAVHLNVDNRRAEAIMRRWQDLGLSRLALEVIEVPDRRLSHAAMELASRAAADEQTEVSVLIPTRAYTGSWAVLLHGKNANRLVRALGQIPHVNATVVPFNVGDVVEAERALRQGLQSGSEGRAARSGRPGRPEADATRYVQVPGTTPIAELRFRSQARVAGRIRSVRVQPASESPALECTITDASGGEVTAVFMGRKEVPGIRTGTQILLTGVVGQRRGQMAILNPIYELLAVPDSDAAPGA
ncbi:MAG TPA: OB-fold nucleic acid binding domain-containing protein [Acidimicrobiales bacterium]|nr:OB-fold nucleic acid binding domain-containing protein [Acidimicrobiales bacterium]